MTTSVTSNWKAAAILLALIAAGLGIELFRIHFTLKKVFHYNVEITVSDSNTGEELEGVTTYYPVRSSSDLFDQSISTSSGPNSRTISGIAYEPRTFGFSAEGYQRKDLVITDETDHRQKVELEPEEKNTPNASSEANETSGSTL